MGETPSAKETLDKMDLEDLGIVKLTYPTDDLMKMLVDKATDEEVVRDADIAAGAVALLAGGKYYGAATAVARLIGYVCRTMGPDHGEQYSIAMEELFDVLGTFPDNKVPPKEKWHLIRNLSATARLTLTAHRAIENMAVAERMYEVRKKYPDANLRYTVGRGELNLFKENPLKRSAP